MQYLPKSTKLFSGRDRIQTQGMSSKVYALPTSRCTGRKGRRIEQRKMRAVM